MSAVITHKDTGAPVAAIEPGLNFKQINRLNADLLVTGQNVTLILSNVLLNDEDVYRCLIKTNTDRVFGQSKDTNLIINSKYSV